MFPYKANARLHPSTSPTCKRIPFPKNPRKILSSGATRPGYPTQRTDPIKLEETKPNLLTTTTSSLSNKHTLPNLTRKATHQTEGKETLDAEQEIVMCRNWAYTYICLCKAPYCGKRDEERRQQGGLRGHVLGQSEPKGQWTYCDLWFLRGNSDQLLNAYAYPMDCPALQIELQETNAPEYCNHCKDVCIPEAYEHA
ncbi:hypothetical protein QQS21_006842 [Conoideocrella luteorostrata]|uniref:Uncharacterized protein n=1 Tax=Conoideocrella luteorostrata TaxID=1105319 RepID=A0AAJ0CPS3_9HYPO|nr:hypothetical protein QQS21_006842 [Conoideocrella luteorostrata]